MCLLQGQKKGKHNFWIKTIPENKLKKRQFIESFNW